MFEYSVRISGPGLCVNGPALIIVEALKNAGFNVIVNNEHANPDLTCEEVIEHEKNTRVTVDVKHQPWGG